MPRHIVIGHMADGTPLTLEIPTLSEYLDQRESDQVDDEIEPTD
jgi:hypothetical protein